MENRTIASELLLSGISELPYLRLPLFVLFVHVFCVTLVGNFLIILLVVIDSHLHTPMYFFLGNLALLDLCSSSLTTPRMIFDLITNYRKISIPACLTQVFFFNGLATTEVLLLAAMSYDRYIAICQPLHYLQIMHWKTCSQMASSSWTLGMINSLIQTLLMLRLNFCNSDIIHSFFCDTFKLFQISCTDVFINILLLLIFGGLIGLYAFLMIITTYVFVFSTVLKIKEMDKRLKAFSTCSSHLTVVFIFYGTLIFNDFRPDTTYEYTADTDTLVSIFYTTVTPLLNPLIYSLRNHELKAAMQRMCKIY